MGIVSGGGGAAGLPLTGGTVTGPLIVHPSSATAKPLQLTGGDGNGNDMLVLTAPHTALAIDDDGGFQLSSNSGLDVHFTGSGATQGRLTVGGAAGTSSVNSDSLAYSGTASPDYSIYADPALCYVGAATFLLAPAAAPADAALGASQFAFWLDATDGVGNTKLMVKAKSANGTVKTATILLA